MTLYFTISPFPLMTLKLTLIAFLLLLIREDMLAGIRVLLNLGKSICSLLCNLLTLCTKYKTRNDQKNTSKQEKLQLKKKNTK